MRTPPPYTEQLLDHHGDAKLVHVTEKKHFYIRNGSSPA